MGWFCSSYIYIIYIYICVCVYVSHTCVDTEISERIKRWPCVCTWVDDYYIRSKSWCWKTWSIDNIENHPSVDGRIWRAANRPVINSNPFFVFSKICPDRFITRIDYSFFFFFSLVSRFSLLRVSVQKRQARSVTMAFAGLKKQINKANQVSLFVFIPRINETSLMYIYIHYHFIIGLSYDNQHS